MNGIKQIFKKEMDRVFKDKKMIFSVFLLPVLIMVVIMSIVGNLASNMEDDIENHTPIVYIQNQPQSFAAYLKETDLKCDLNAITSSKERKNAENEILNGKADLIIEFPESFDAQVADYTDGDQIPQIKTYYNPSEDYSSSAFSNISGDALEGYRQTLLSQRMDNMEKLVVFQVNSDNDNMIIQDDKKASGKALGMMLPYFITILLFAGAMGIGSDMIAGEKERGTMASLLVSPIKRSSIVLGKVFSLMAISGLSSLVYVVVMVVCMPLMMKSMAPGADSAFNLQLSVPQIVMLGALLVAIAFLYSTIIALLSVFAKSTKEASTYIMPVYMLVLIIGLVTMFTTGGPDNVNFFIPIYNNALAFQGILSQEITMVQYAATLIETLVLGGILTAVIVKAFETEKVMAK